MGPVRTVLGDDRPLPTEVERVVAEVAAELGRQVASDDLYLLALARLGPGSNARQSLDAAGVTAVVLLAHIRTGGDGVQSPGKSLTYSPAYYGMRGRAEAFAAALGDGTVTAEHVLIALLWDADSHSSQILWRMGVSRERLVEELQARGVAVPSSGLPPQREVELGEEVWFDRDQVRTVIDHLRLHLPPGTHWGFNYEGDRAYVSSETTIDLQALVAEALPPTIEIWALDHVQLAMPEGREDDATAFYEGLLGLTRVPKPHHLAGRGGCWFERGEVRVHLGVDPDFRPARKAHPALVVRGLVALADRLRVAGMPVVEGEDQVYVDDPFGNRVELLERGDTLHGPP